MARVRRTSTFSSHRISEQAGAGWQLLLDSIVLDQAPGPERVFAVFSPAPLDLAVVTPLLRAAAAAGDGTIRALQQLRFRTLRPPC